MEAKYKKIYVILFAFSLFAFLGNFLIQRQINFTYDYQYGLLFKMNILFWAGFIVLFILTGFQFVRFGELSDYVFFSLALLTIYLIGTPFFYEYLPRFEDTWGHSFLAEQMFKQEKINLNFHPYEKYPGSFLFFGLLFQLSSSYSVMKFFPLFFYFIGLTIVYFSFKHLINEKVSFLASVLYIFFNWTAEDNHISPQFLMLGVYFLFIYSLIRILTDNTNKKYYFILSILSSIVIVVSHPITPVFILLILGMQYLLCKKFRSKLLPLILILTVIFITYNAFFTSFLKDFFLDLQFIYRTFSGNIILKTSTRFTTNFFERQVFLYSRLGITILSIILGLFGFFAMRKSGYKLGANFFLSWTAAMIIFSIFLIVSSKGAYYERFALISSLPLAVLSSYFLSEHKIGYWIVLILIIIAPFYMIAKYGNEALESVSVEKINSICFSESFNTGCVNNQQVVASSLNYDFQNLGDSFNIISREEIIASSIYTGKNLDDVFRNIDMIAQEKKLDKLYATNYAEVFV